MAVHRNVKAVSMEAAGDLSSNQFRIVYVDDTGKVNVNTSTATVCLGVLLNKPSASGQAALVAIDGAIVKCEAGATLNERDRVVAVAGGRGSASTTATHMTVGVALTAAGSGELFECLVNPETG